MSLIKEDVIVVKELLVTRIKGPSSALPVTIGTGSTSQGLASRNDLFVTGKLEVDGISYFDGVARHYSNLAFNLSGNTIIWGGGTATATRTQLSFSNTTDQMVWGLGSDQGRQLVIGDAAYTTDDFDHATPTNPTLFIHSAEDPDTANTQWVSISHDQTDGNIDCGTGTLNLGATGNVNFAGATHTGTGDTATNGYVTLEVAGAAIKFATIA